MSEKEDRLRSLLLSGLAGDAARYHTFLKELSGHLRAFLRGRLSRLPDDVEDLVQETLLAVHNQRHTYDAGQPLTAWVHAIARYKLVDLLRRRSTRDALTDPLDDEATFFAQSDVEAASAKRGRQIIEAAAGPATLADCVYEAGGPVGGGDRKAHGHV